MKKLLALGVLFVSFITVLFTVSLLTSPVKFESSTTPILISLGVFAFIIVKPFVAPTKFYKYHRSAFTEGICEKVQSSLIQLLGSKAPSLKRTQVGYLQALKSPQNMNGIEVVPIDPGNGKKKEVRIKYIQRGTSNHITTTEVSGCATSFEREPLEETVTIENYVGTKGILFTEDEMRKLCEPDSEWMAGIINSELDPLVVKLNQQIIAAQAANFGSFGAAGGGTGPKSVKLLDSTNNDAPVFSGEADMMEDFAKNDISDRPLVIGSGKLAKYTRMARIGCCNTNGISVNRQGDFDFFYDRFVEPGIGTDEFIALVPGYVQLLQWNKYKGSYVKENDVFSHTTIIDPWSGLEFDMKWHYNDCDDNYSLHFGTRWKLYFIPSNAFNTQYDDLSGVNFSFNYKATA